MNTLLQDLKYALRMLAKQPGFAAIAVVTLALGIGASTAVFSVVNAVLLKSLPYPNAERIVMLWRLPKIDSSFGNDDWPWRKKDFLLLLQESRSFQYLGGFKSDSFNMTGSQEPALLDGTSVSAGFFPALGVSPALGRAFTSEEDQPGHEHVVVLSHDLWSDRFGGDPSVLGRAVDLNGYPYTVIGIMPPGFAFPRGEEMPETMDLPRRSQLWVPLALPVAPRGPNELGVVARLKPGVTTDQVNAELAQFATLEDRQFPEAIGWYNSRVISLARQVAGDTRRPLLLILAAIGLVLLIACANVASLLLARSFDRKREFTIRAALGAGHSRMIRQLLTESLLLAALGGFLGILFAVVCVHFVKVLGPPDLPRLQEITLDLRVLAFALGISLITGILFGLAPAVAATKENLVESLKQGGQRAGGSPAGHRIRSALLVSDVALALVLVVAAGLLIRTFYFMTNARAGFNPERVLTFELSLPTLKYPDADSMAHLYQSVLLQLHTVSGVESAGLVSAVPMAGAPDGTTIRIPEHPSSNDREMPYANYSFCSPGYFSALEAPLLRGRDFIETDTADSLHVTIINNAMAKKFWPGEDPVGKQVGVADTRWGTRTIVGVVTDIKHSSLSEDPAPEMYVPYTQNEIKIWPSMRTLQVALRTKADPTSVTASVREAVHSVDPDLPLAKVGTLSALVQSSMAKPLFSTFLLSSFGGIALLLATMGMYGVISYSVGQRTKEIGIRMALGATRSNVFGMILRHGARLTALGILIGLLAALGMTRTMASFLYGVKPTDPVTFAGVSLLLVAVTLLASYVPARRATRVDPMTALHDE
jgi:putative ABC transport system permease protein